MNKWRLISLTFVFSIIFLAIFLLVYWNVKDDNERNEEKVKEEYLRALVNRVNSNPNSSWKAKYNKFGERVSTYPFQAGPRDYLWVREYYNEIKAYAESEEMHKHLRELRSLLLSPLPQFFDSRLKWPHCPSLHHVPNQGGCGSCYAVAAVSVASDRLCIHSNGSFRSILSAYDAISCCENCGGCYGGDPLNVLNYFVKEGIVTGGRDGCKPYSYDRSCGVPCSPATYETTEKMRRCEKKCQHIYYQKEYKEDKYHGSFAYSLLKRRNTLFNHLREDITAPTVVRSLNLDVNTNETEILTLLKHEIMTYGPITLTFPVTEEFLHYSSGIFRPYPRDESIARRIVYWHVVRLIGWGSDEEGNHYWLAVNSFGSYWGENGLFKINLDDVQIFGLEYEAVL